MSNKMNVSTSAAVHLDLNDHKTPGLFYCSAAGESYTNKPEVPDNRLNSFCLIVEKTGANGDGIVQTLTAYQNLDGNISRWIRTFNLNTWGDWVPLATATPPQEYSLPLAAGMSVQGSLSAKYSKNQFGEVIVRGCLIGQKSNGDVIATLPVGFRPKSTFEVPAMFGFTAGRIQIDAQGSIRVVTGQSSVSSVQFSAVFIAADV